MAESYSVEAVLSVADKGFTSGLKNAQSALTNLTAGTKKGSIGVGGLAKAFGIANIATSALKKGISAISGSVGDAVSRFDTLNNASRVFENMGFSAQETEGMMENLKTSIKGLPTPLDSAVKGVQQLAASNRDLSGAEQIYSAMNNAILGFGGSNEDVSRAVEMFSRSLSKGKMHGQEFNTLMQTMGPVMNAVADEMGYTIGELQTGLSNGSISLDDFTDTLLRLNKEGAEV